MKLNRSLIMSLTLFVFVFGCVAGALAADQLKIGIMQSKKGQAKKYAPLVAYMKTKGIEVSLVGTKNYPDAAVKFSSGQLDAMFSGSGIAGSMIIKGLAEPLVRPVSKSGWSTYWAVVVGPKGSPKYNASPSYFDGKNILACSLASSGEFYFRSLHEGQPLHGTLKKAASHGAALQALAKGAADYAVVKNRVWDSMVKNPKNQAWISKLEVVGKDSGENPNGTLIIAASVSAETRQKVSAALLAPEADTSAEAEAVKASLKVQKYIVTTADDFSHTVPMLKSAGVDKNFNFEFTDNGGTIF